jgi:hypothetical protein
MGQMDGNMQMAHICQTYGWTYEEYQEQPTWFLELIRKKLSIDQKAEAQALKKHRVKGN